MKYKTFSLFALVSGFLLVAESLAAQISTLTHTSGLGYDGAIVQRNPQSRDGSVVFWTPTEDDVAESEVAASLS
jgi:hypothetical protein